MAGHSKWENIKRRKAKVDAVKGKSFSKLSRDISIAARLGGNPDENPRLRLAISKARAGNMPMSNIEKAIQKASSEKNNEMNFIFEIYGKGGVGIIVDATSDNKHAVVSDINTVLKRHNANMAIPGAVKHLFEKKFILIINKILTEEDAMNLALSVGCDDFYVTDNSTVMIFDEYPSKEILDNLYGQNVSFDIEEAFHPKNLIECNNSDKDINSIIINSISDIDCVADIFHNMKED